MQSSEVTMILQAIKELSDKVDSNSNAIQILSEKVDSNSNAIQILSEKVDNNHISLTKRLDRLDDGMEYIQHKIMDHDQVLFKMRRS